MKRLTNKRLALPPGVWQEVTREQRMELQAIPVPSKQELYYRLFQIEEILRVCKRYDCISFKSWDDVFDVLEKYLTDEEFEKLPESESECRAYYDALPWKKAIIVYITTLD